MTHTDEAYWDDGHEVDDASATEDTDGSARVPDLTADVVPTVGNLLPDGLPLLPGVGPDLAGPDDPIED